MHQPASNRQRSRMSKRMWAIFREAGGDAPELSLDPLGRLYEVNKFGIHADFETRQEADEVRERVLALLTIAGWEIERENPKKVSRFYASFTDAACKAYVEMPHDLPTGGARISVGVTTGR